MIVYANPTAIVIIILIVIAAVVYFVRGKLFKEEEVKKTEEEYAKETVDAMLVKHEVKDESKEED